MKHLGMRVAALIGVLLWAGTPLSAQTATTVTTLSAAVTTANGQTITLASATNVAANGALFVDREYMSVVSVTGTTVRVVRGAGGTIGATHRSGTQVWVASPAQVPNVFRSFDKAGSCAPTAELFLPQINIQTGAVQGCNCVARTTGVCTQGIWGGASNAAPLFGGIGVTLVSNANYTVLPEDTMVVYDTLTANRVVAFGTASVPGKTTVLVNASGSPYILTVSGTIAGSTTYTVATNSSLRLTWSGASWFSW